MQNPKMYASLEVRSAGCLPNKQLSLFNRSNTDSRALLAVKKQGQDNGFLLLPEQYNVEHFRQQE